MVGMIWRKDALEVKSFGSVFSTPLGAKMYVAWLDGSVDMLGNFEEYNQRLVACCSCCIILCTVHLCKVFLSKITVAFP